MNQVTHIVDKARQAPWRAQRQWIGLLLLAFVAVAMVAGLYLSVTARASIGGREIQTLTEQINTQQRDNADLQIQLAGLTSARAMQSRAEHLGFAPVALEEILYVQVMGYTPAGAVDLSSNDTYPPTPILLPAYTESLFDWVTRKLTVSARRGGQP